MPHPVAKKKTVKKSSPLKRQAKKPYPIHSHIVTEQRKEIARLQKLVARIEVKKDSEIARLKAKLAEEKKSTVKVVLQRYDEKH